jgi:hypothetical protein
VVIKGTGTIIEDRQEKTLALNGLMGKYQPEGRYEKITPNMEVVDEVAIIKVVPKTMYGKYKIGQHMNTSSRTELAKKIFERNSATAKKTLRIMGFEVSGKELRLVDEPLW